MSHKLFSRIVSMVLVVVLAVTMLPVSVLAAWRPETAEAEKQETPVADGTPADAQTSGQWEVGGERPEPGGDPEEEDPAAEPQWTGVSITSVKIGNDGSWEVTVRKALSDRAQGDDSGSWVLVLAPDAKQRTAGQTPSQRLSSLNADMVSGNVSGLVSQLVAAELGTTDYVYVGSSNNNFRFTPEPGDTGYGTYTFRSTDSYSGTGINATLPSLATLTSAGHLKDYYLADGTTKIATDTASIPFVALVYTMGATPEIARKTGVGMYSGGHIADATYTLDLRAGTAVGDAKYDGGGGNGSDATGYTLGGSSSSPTSTLTVTVINDGEAGTDGAVTLGHATVVPAGEGDSVKSSEDGYNVKVNGGGSTTITVNIGTSTMKNGGNISVEVPYTYEEGETEVSKSATITIRVWVAQPEDPLDITAEKITFHVTSGQHERKTSGILYTCLTSGISEIYMNGKSVMGGGFQLDYQDSENMKGFVSMTAASFVAPEEMGEDLAELMGDFYTLDGESIITFTFDEDADDVFDTSEGQVIIQGSIVVEVVAGPSLKAVDEDEYEVAWKNKGTMTIPIELIIDPASHNWLRYVDNTENNVYMPKDAEDTGDTGSLSVSNHSDYKTGWQFKHWLDDDGNTYSAGNNVDVSKGSVTLTAVWKVKVTFDLADGNANAADTWASITPQWTDQGSAVGTWPKKPSKDRKVFNGWKSGGVEYTAASTFNAPTDLVADWGDATYTVTYAGDVHGTGISLPGPDTNISGSYEVKNIVGMLPADRIVKDGDNYYRFDGWTKPGDTTTVYGPFVSGKTHINVDQDITLTSHWTTMYKIDYDINGATLTGDPLASFYVAAGSDYASGGGLHGGSTGITAPNAAGSGKKVFKGWTTDTNDLTTKVEESGKPGSSLTLHAYWQDNVSITFKKNDGTADNVDTIYGQPGDSLTGKFPATPSRSGYNFLGWTETNASTDKDYKNESDYNSGKFPNANATLYAQWEEKNTTINFHWNEPGTPSAAIAVSGKPGTTAMPPTPQPTVTGYQRVGTGWFTLATGGVADDLKFPAVGGEPRDVYAHWDKEGYKVTYKSSKGTILGTYETPGDNVQFDEDYNIVAKETVIGGDGNTWDGNILVLAGTGGNWRFDGWTATVHNTGDYADGATISKVQGNITLTAKWQEMYKVTYDPNGGSGEPAAYYIEATKKLSDGGASWKPTTAPTGAPDARDGVAKKQFRFWGASTSATSAISGDTVPTNNITVYAIWQDQIEVKFLKNAGDTTTAHATLYGFEGAGLTKPADPTWDGHKFTGWAETSTGSVVTPVTTFPSADKVYYAIWSTNTVTVNFYKDDNTHTTGTYAPGAIEVELSDGTHTYSKTISAGDINAVLEGVVPGNSYTLKVAGATYGTYDLSGVDAAPRSIDVDYFTVTIDTSDDSVTAATGAGTYLKGTEITPTATADTNYDPSTLQWRGGAEALDPGIATSGISGKKVTANQITVNWKLEYAPKFTKIKVTVNIKIMKNGADWNVDGAGAWTDVVPVMNASTNTSALGPAGVQELRAPATGNVISISNLEAGDSYKVWPRITDGGSTSDSVSVDVVLTEATTKDVTLNYYDLTVQATTSPDSGAKAGQDLTTVTTSTAASTVAYYTGTTVKIKAEPSNSNFKFKEWTVSTGGSAPAATGDDETAVTVGTETTLTATFEKENYSAVLTLTLDGATVAGKSGDKKDPDMTGHTDGDITKVEVVKTDGTATDPSDLQASWNGTAWEVMGLKTANKYQWKITTVSGAYTTATNSINTVGPAFNDSSLSYALFGVTVDEGSYASAVTVEAPGQTTPAGTRAVAPAGSAFALSATAKDGYTQKTGGDAWAEGTASQGTVNGNTYTITTPDGTWPAAGQTLTPQYNFFAFIDPQYDGSTLTSGVDSVVLKEGTTSVTATQPTGSYLWKADNLTIGKIYEVWVNGFKAGTTAAPISVTETANAGSAAEKHKIVPMIKIEVDTDPADADGTVSVKLGAASGGSATEVYVPTGASTGSGADQVSIKATAGTKFRLKNNTWDSVDTWTKSGVGTAAVTGANNADTEVTFSELTGDVKVTANFRRHYDVTVALDTSGLPAGASKADGTKVEITAAQSNGTSIAVGEQSADPVDADTYVTVVFTADTGDSLKGWKVTKGKLYNNADLNSSHEITAGAATDTTGTVYFVPTDDGAKLEAIVKKTEYTVTVKVYLDNAPLTGKQVKVDTVDLTEVGTSGVYTKADAFLPGTYKIHTNVVSVTDDEATLTFAAGASDNDRTVELYYYTVNVKTADDITDGTDKLWTVVDSSSVTAPSAAGVDSMVFLKGRDVHIAATANNYGTTATKHYRFTNWTVSQVETVDIASPTAANNNETSFTLNSAKLDKIGAGNSNAIVLTANYQQQWKVTLKEDTDSDSYGAISAPTGTAVHHVTSSGGGYVFYVDVGGVAKLANTEASGCKVIGWTIDPAADAGTFYKSGTTTEIAANTYSRTISGAAGSDVTNAYVDNTSATTRKAIDFKPAADVTATVYYGEDKFSFRIQLNYDSAEYNEGSVTTNIDVYDTATNNRVASRTITGTGISKISASTGTYAKTGNYTVLGLSNDNTYYVKINGYTATEATGIDKTKNNSEVAITMYRITREIWIDGVDATADPKGNTVEITTNSAAPFNDFSKYNNGISGKNGVYLPKGANLSVTNQQLKLEASKATGYRLNNAADTALWSVNDAATDIDNVKANAGKWVPAALGADAVVKGFFTTIYDLTAVASTGGTVNIVKVAGNATDETAGASVTVTLDKDQVAEVVAIPKTVDAYEGYGFKTWTDSPKDDQWYDDLTTADAGATRTITEFYKPIQNTTLTATFAGLKVVGEGSSTEDNGATVEFNTTDGLVITVPATYAVTDAVAKLTLTNPGSAAATTLAVTQNDSTVFDQAPTVGTPASLGESGDGSVTDTLTVPLPSTRKAVGTYTMSVTVRSAEGAQVTIPVKLEVKANDTFDVRIKTFPDGSLTSTNANIQHLYLVPTAGATDAVKATWNVTDKYWAATLKWGGTYTVYVDGLATSTTGVDNSVVAAGTNTYAEYDVKDLYTVYFEKDDYKTNNQGEPQFTVTNALSGQAGVAAADQADIVIKAETTGAKLVIPGGKTISLDAKPHSSATPYYRFGKWQHTLGSTAKADVTSGTTATFNYTVGTAANSAATTAPVVLDPQYIRQFKVTFKAAEKAASTNSAPTGVTVDMAVDSGAAATKNAGDSILVDTGSVVKLSGLSKTTGDATYLFSTWAVTGSPKTDSTITGAPADNALTAAAMWLQPVSDDVELTPTYWVKPTISADQTFDLGLPVSTTNPLPKFTWTANDATWDSTKGIEKGVATVATSKYTPTAIATGTEFELTLAYLIELGTGTHTLTFNSDTPNGTGTGDDANHAATPLTATVTITASQHKLTQVDIVKQGDTSATHAASGDKLTYNAHKNSNILTSDLTWTWYMKDTAPTPSKASDSDEDVSASGYPNYDSLTAAEAVAGATQIPGEIGNSLTITDAMKGKYVFAIAVASKTGTKVAISNAIPVDYDATITVVENNGTADSAPGTTTNYEVYLVPTNLHESASGVTNLGATGIVKATDAGGGTFSTTGGKLVGGVTYKVYTNIVSGQTGGDGDPAAKAAQFKDSGAGDITMTSQTAKVTYYQVNIAKTAVKNTYADLVDTDDDLFFVDDAGDGSNTDLNDTLLEKPKATALVNDKASPTNTIDVADQAWVQKGTAVTFSYPDWVKDYTLKWAEAGLGTDLDTTTTTNAQSASGASQSVTYSTAQTPTTAKAVKTRLDLNLYDVTAYVIGEGGTLSEIKMVLGSNTFTTVGDASHIYHATGTTTGNIAATTAGAQVKFQVPKADFAASATAASPATQIQKYAAPHGGTEVTWVDTTTTVAVPVATTKSFDIKTAGTNQAMTLADNASNEAKATYDGTTSANGTAARTIDVYYGYTSAVSVPLTVKNTSSGSPAQDIHKVTMDLSSDPGNATSKIVFTSTDFGNGTAGDVSTPVATLTAAEAAKTAKLELPVGENVDQYKYVVKTTFASVSGGAAVANSTYTLTINVKPVEIVGVTVASTATVGTTATVKIENYSALSGGFDKVMVDNDGDRSTAAVPASSIGSTPNVLNDGNDVKYQWVRANAGTTVEKSDFAVTAGALGLTTAGSAKSGLELIATGTGKQYTVANDDLGKVLYLVAWAPNQTGTQLNVKGHAVSAGIPVKYRADIQVNLDGVQQPDPNPATNNTDPTYALELKATDNSDTLSTSAGTIKWDTTTNTYYAELIPGKTYDLNAEVYKGAQAAGVALAKVTSISSKPAANVEVDYYAITTTTDVAIDNVDTNGLGFKSTLGTTQNTDKVLGGLTASVASKDITSPTGTPVLKGQSVTFTVNGLRKMDGNGDDAAGTGDSWKGHQHYTLTFTGNTNISSSDYAYPSATSDKVTVSKNAETIGTTAVATKLTQNRYDVEFIVKGTGSLSAYTLAADATETGTTYSDAKTETKNVNDKLTFSVPAGAFKLSATPSDGSVITKYGYEGNTATPTAGTNGEIAVVVTKKSNDTTKNYVELGGASYSVTWLDNFDDSTSFASSTGFQQKGAKGLTFGYSATPLSYTVRVKNNGDAAIPKFNVTNSDAASTFTVTTVNGFDKTDAPIPSFTLGTTSLPVDGYVEMTVAIPAGKDASGSDYTITLTAVSDDATVTVGGDTTYKPVYTVAKAPIKIVTVDGITKPAISGTRDINCTTATITPTSGAATCTTPTTISKALTWAPNDATFAGGREYTVSVSYTADSNHYFVPVASTGEAFTILTKHHNETDADGGKATVTVPDGGATITLSYTFPATAPGLALNTSSTAARLTGKIDDMTVTADSGYTVDVYYIVVDQTTTPTAPADNKAVLNAYLAGAGATVTSVGKIVNLGAGAQNNSGNGWDVDAGLKSNGTNHIVYAVAVKHGEDVSTAAKITAAATAGKVSPMASSTFKTAYRVEVQMAGASSTSTIAKPANVGTSSITEDSGKHVAYVKATSGNTETTDVQVNVASDAHFVNWSLTSGGGTFAAPTSDTTTFKPTANSVVKATFEGVPKLKLTGVLRSNQISKDYDTELSLLNNGKGTNIGNVDLKGKIKTVVTDVSVYDETTFKALIDGSTGKIDDSKLTAATNKYIKASLGSAHQSNGSPNAGGFVLAKTEYADILLKPGTTDGNPLDKSDPDPDHHNNLTAKWAKANADTGTSERKNVTYFSDNGVDIGVYNGYLWIYDENDPTDFDMMPVYVKVVDEGYIATALEKTWDLNPKDPLPDKTHENWVININTFGVWQNSATLTLKSVTKKGSTTPITLPDDTGLTTTLTMGGSDDWNFGTSITSGYDKDVTIFESTIWTITDALVDSTNIKLARGDKLTFSFSLTSNDGNNTVITKDVVLTYIDTTPNVAISTTSTVVKANDTIKATVATTAEDGYTSPAEPAYNDVAAANNAFTTPSGMLHGLGKRPAVDVDAEVRWYSVPGGTSVDGDSDGVITEAELVAAGATLLQSDAAADGVTTKTGSAAGGALEYKAQTTDTGKDIYVAIKGNNYNYRGANVAGPIYVGSVVNLKAYQTGNTVDLSGVKVKGEFGTDTKYSPSGVLVVDTAGGKVTLTAPQQDDNDLYYFTTWADSSGNGTFDTGTITALNSGFTPAGDTTIIGYYDLLPTLSINGGTSYTYNIYTDTVGGSAAKLPKLTYANNDGGVTTTAASWDQLSITITPKGDNSTWKDGTKAPKTLKATTDDLTAMTGLTFLASAAPGAEVADGDYTLGYAWIKANLKLDDADNDQEYEIKFVDEGKMSNGTSTTNTGTAYDKTVTLTVPKATFTVTGGGIVVEPPVTPPSPPITELHPASNSATAQATAYYMDDVITSLGDLTITGTAGLTFDVSIATSADLTNDKILATGDPMLAKIDAATTSADKWIELKGTYNGVAVGTDIQFQQVGSKPIKGIHVAKDKDDATKDAHNELVLYVKVEEKHSGIVKYVPYTVDIMTSPLHITSGWNGTKYETLYKNTEPGSPMAIAHGDPVKLEYFLYTKVENDKNQTGDVVITPNATTGLYTPDDNSAIGAGSGVVTVNNLQFQWSVAPATFDGVDPLAPTAPSASNNYVFKVTYQGDVSTPGTTANPYDYSDATMTIAIPVAKPAVGLQFEDVNAADSSDAVAAAVNAVRTAGPDIYKPDNSYPTYKVTLSSVSTNPVYDVRLTVSTKAGVTETRTSNTIPASFTSTTGGVYVYDVALDKMGVDAATGVDKWVGIHTVTITAEGFSTAGKSHANNDTPEVTATYTFTYTVNPKKITETYVTLDPTNPDTNPPTVKGILATDPVGTTPHDLNTPETGAPKPPILTPVVVTPDTTDPDKKTVTLTPNPNYEFEAPDKKTALTDDGDERIDGHDDDTPGVDVKKKGTGELEFTTYVITLGAHLATSADAAVDSAFSSLIGKEIRGYRAQSDDTTKYPRTGTTYGTDWWWSMGDAPGTQIDPFTADATSGEYPKFEEGKTYVLTIRLDPKVANYPFPAFVDMKATFDQPDTVLTTQNLTRVADTTTPTVGDPTTLFSQTRGFTIATDYTGNYYLRNFYTYTTPPTPPATPTETCPYKVSYWLGLNGTTKDSTIENVAKDGKPASVPTVTPVTGYKFVGWSLTKPVEGKESTLIDPAKTEIKEDTVFYAVYEKTEPATIFHEHYVIGYPNGTFGPADYITRGSVATIIARAVLSGFVEGADYGNPGNFTDVKGHWAESAIAYCYKAGAMIGMGDGTFRPDDYITREQLALTLARLLDVKPNQGINFPDADEVHSWAADGVYTAIQAGLMEGDNSGLLRPLASISRAETVTVFNRFLNRGVDAAGLSDLKEYIHTGVASNNTENGVDEYMTWSDVPKGHWAYHAIIEAANDHEFHYTGTDGKSLPEKWTRCWIDERWRYNDNLADGGPSKKAASAQADETVVSNEMEVSF